MSERSRAARRRALRKGDGCCEQANDGMTMRSDLILFMVRFGGIAEGASGGRFVSARPCSVIAKSNR